MTAQPETKKKAAQSRRDFLRKVGVGSATAAGVSAGAIRLDHGPVQNSQAIAPAVAAAGLGGSVAVGWALREYEVVGSDDAPEGMTADALHGEVYNTFQARASTNASTIIDNKNIIDGIKDSLWADGKLAAIDSLNDQQSQDDVLDSAKEAKNDNISTVIKNLLETWDEAV